MLVVKASRIAATVGLALALATPGLAEEKWATVHGQVTWGGKSVPVPPAIAPDGLIVNPRSHGVKYVCVWLIDASDPNRPKAPPINPALKAAPDVKVTIQAGPPRHFEPRAIAVQQGQLGRVW